MERIRKAKEILDCCRRYCSYRRNRLGERMVGIPRISCLILSSIGLIGCTTLKKAGIVSLGAGGGALVGTVLSGGAAAPILGATTGAFVVDAATGLITSSGKTQTIIKAPDNVFTLAHKITELAGWSLILIFVLPMVFGWIFPSPFETKKRKRR